jgi:hypothetical protein
VLSVLLWVALVCLLWERSCLHPGLCASPPSLLCCLCTCPMLSAAAGMSGKAAPLAPAAAPDMCSSCLSSALLGMPPCCAAFVRSRAPVSIQEPRRCLMRMDLDLQDSSRPQPRIRSDSCKAC